MDEDIILAVCKRCGFHFVNEHNHASPDALAQAAELADFLAVVADYPTTAKALRSFAERLRREIRREARWDVVWRLLAPIGHPAAHWVMLAGFWMWWLLDDASYFGPWTWPFRAGWTGWMLAMIVQRHRSRARRRARHTPGSPSASQPDD